MSKYFKISSFRLLIILLFFISGFSGLIYQVMWNRQFKLILGSSIVSVSIIVAIFMLGLLLGSWWIGKKLEAKKSINELFYYGILEIIIGLFGFALIFILPKAHLLFSVFSTSSIEFNYFELILNILSTFLLLGIPTIAMGATLPLLINHFSKIDTKFRQTIGQFYSINALGGALASLISGFILLRYLGVQNSIIIAILLNILIGIIALIKSRSYAPENNVEVDKIENDKVNLIDIKYSKILLMTALLTGFISISYEVLWIRCINYILNSSTYTFSIILFIFLLGIAIGSALMSTVRKLKNKELTLSIFQLLLSILGILIIYLFYEYAYSETFYNFFIVQDSSVPSWSKNVGLNLTFSLLVFLFPSILMGMSFPLISDIYFQHKKTKSGVAISKVYIANTFGSILGALIPVFLLIPVLGSLKSTLYLLAILNLIIALFFVLKSRAKKKFLFTAVYILIFGLVIVKTESGSTLASLEGISEDSSADKPIFYKEGIMATVKVYNKNNTYKSLSIDGVTIASEAFKAKESIIGHLPFFTKQKINSVLAVGLASGSTVGSILKHEEVNHVDVVEIVPSVLNTLHYFKSSNQNVQHHEKVDIYIDDILSFLLYTDKKYDLISSDGKFGILNKSNTTMLSKDYYEICQKHLTEEGLFIQWISTEIPNKHLRVILNTVNSVFSHSELFLIRKNLFILSSNSPVYLDNGRILESLKDQHVLADINASGIYTPTEMMSFYIGPNTVSIKDNSLNTLNNPLLEYDYNKERTIDVQANGTSAYTNFLFLFDQLKRNKTKIESSKNTITENKIVNSFTLSYNFFNSRLAFFKGNMALEKQDVNEAVKQFKIVITDNHRDNINNIAVSAKSIGEIYLQQKKYGEAISYFNLAIEKLSGYSNAYTLRGIAHYYNGDTLLCKKDMEKALTINPNDKTAIEFLKFL